MCFFAQIVLSPFAPLPALIPVAYFAVLGFQLRDRAVWALLLVPVVIGFAVSPHDAVWLVALGLVSIPGAIGLAIGRVLARRGETDVHPTPTASG